MRAPGLIARLCSLVVGRRCAVYGQLVPSMGVRLGLLVTVVLSVWPTALPRAGAWPGIHTSQDRVDHRMALSAPNGTSETWSYDTAGRPTSATVVLTGTTLFSQTDTLDAAGQRRSIDDSWGQSSFTYDPAGWLAGATYPDGSGETDQYDAVGNRTVITSTVGLTSTVTTNTLDAADQLTSSSARVNGGCPALTTDAYDANGNQLGSVGPTGAITNTYNLANQLIQVAGPTTDVTYVYDGQRRPGPRGRPLLHRRGWIGYALAGPKCRWRRHDGHRMVPH